MTMTLENRTHCARRSRLGILARLMQLRRLGKQRKQLAALDTHQLADIGLTPEAAQSEATRPIWDVPASWRT